MNETGEQLDRLIERLAAAEQRRLDRDRPARHARMRAEVLACWPEHAGARSRPRAWIGALAAGAVLAATLVAWVAVGPRPWVVHVDEPGQGRQAQLFVAAGDDQPVVVSFANGGVLTLRPKARVRMEAPSDETASLVLESGTIEVVLEPAARGEWTIVAGPHRLAARAATLTVGWQPEHGAFELVAHTGAARVEGPRLPGARTIQGGERLRIVDEGDDPHAEPAEAPVADVLTPAVEPRAELAPPLPARAQRRSRGQPATTSPLPALQPTPEPDAPWRALAREGSHAQAITAAEAVGFSSLCATLDAELLLELADTARYAGRTSLAREALLALRRRFSGTDAAAAAAFDLGRLAPRDAAGCKDMTRWLRIYLDERPDGPMAGVAPHRLDECAALRTPEELAP